MERAELRRLLGRLAEGDRAAFRPAFALLWPQLRAFCVRLAGEPDGEDAAQAALLRIFARASEYDPERDPLPWALGLAAWECRTLRRARWRRREDSAAPEPGGSGEPSPEEAAIERDLLAAASRVLGTLSSMDVETITSIATGARPVQGATFRKRLERALSRFRMAWRARHGAD